MLIPTATLTWDAETARFVTEASELQHNTGARFGSHLVLLGRDGRKVPLTFYSRKDDNEGDTLFWDYIPATETPVFNGLRIFND